MGTVKIRRGFTLPNPELEFSSRRFDLEVEAPTYEEASALIESLIAREVNLKFPDLFVANDKLSSLKKFLTLLAANPTIGKQVQLEWKKYLTPSPQLSND